MRRSYLSTLLLASMSLSTSISALEFTAIGAKATGMGGTGVSSARVSLAGYYNPALLAKAKSSVEVTLGGGINSRDNGTGKSINKLSNSGFQETYERLNQDPTNISQEDIDTLTRGKNIVLGMDDTGVLIAPDAYFSAQILHFGIAVYGVSEAAAAAQIDKRYNRIIVGNTTYGFVDVENPNFLVGPDEYKNSSVVYAVENGIDNLDASALLLVEVPLSYGYAFLHNQLSVGASLKFMQGTTYQDSIDINSNNVQKEIEDTKTDSSTIGIDFGLLYTPNQVKNLRVGLVAKNLNTPSFDTYSGAKHTIDPMIRFGLSYDIFDSLEIAFDSDLTSNKTPIDTFDTQNAGLGLNYHPFSFTSLSVGLMDNLASGVEGTVYTAGIGLGPEAFHLEVGAHYASNETTVEGTTYPNYVKVNFAIVSTW